MSLSSIPVIDRQGIELKEPRLQSLTCPLYTEKDIRVSVLRLDEIHPDLGGNKWYKLRPNIETLVAQNLSLAVSFGGAWSNHLRALAAAGRDFGFRTLGFVRGERSEPLNPVLAFAQSCGMEIRYLSRSDYRRKEEPAFIAEITADLDEHLLIPEGGSNAAAVQGCSELARYLRWEVQPLEAERPLRYVALACGTGTTMAGLLRGLQSRQLTPQSSVCVLGVSVLKAPGYISRQIENLLGPDCDYGSQDAPSWRVLDDYHCGGYARSDSRLKQFLMEYAATSPVPVEPVYTGKLMFAVQDQIVRGEIPEGSELIIVHSGGVNPT